MSYPIAWKGYFNQLENGVNMKIARVNIARDFSPAPAGRNRNDGPYNGFTFRHDVLLRLLRDNEVVEVDLDGVQLYTSSFLDEAFGGLVKYEGMKKEEVLRRLKFVARHRVSDIARIMEKIDSASLPLAKSV